MKSTNTVIEQVVDADIKAADLKEKEARLEISKVQLTIEKIDTLRLLITQVVVDPDKGTEAYRNLFDAEDEIAIKGKIMKLINTF